MCSAPWRNYVTARRNETVYNTKQAKRQSPPCPYDIFADAKVILCLGTVILYSPLTLAKRISPDEVGM